MSSPQFDSRRRLRHVLTTEGWSRTLLTQVLDRIDAITRADKAGRLHDQASLREALGYASKAGEAGDAPDALGAAAGMSCRIVFLPMADSGPAPVALHLAARWGGWPLSHVESDAASSFDAPAHLLARAARIDPSADVLVIAHPASGMSYALAAVAPPHLKIINLLDGAHAAPLAALAELATLRRRLPDLHTRVLSLSGDLVDDPRLRTFIHLLTTLGVPRVDVVHAGAHVPVGASQLGVHVVPAGEHDATQVGVDALIGFPVPPDLGRVVTFHGLPAEQGIDEEWWRDVHEKSHAHDVFDARHVRALASVFCAVILQLMAPT